MSDTFALALETSPSFGLSNSPTLTLTCQLALLKVKKPNSKPSHKTPTMS